VGQLQADEQVLLFYGKSYWEVPFSPETQQFLVQPVINGANLVGPEEVVPEEDSEDEGDYVEHVLEMRESMLAIEHVPDKKVPDQKEDAEQVSRYVDSTFTNSVLPLGSWSHCCDVVMFPYSICPYM
jgi:hypothetical protein